MSIEMENPQTLVELIDAASNYVAQIRLASAIGDNSRLTMCLDKAGELLHEALQKADAPTVNAESIRLQKTSEGRRVACLHAKEMIQLLADKRRPSKVSYIALIQTLTSCAKP